MAPEFRSSVANNEALLRGASLVDACPASNLITFMTLLNTLIQKRDKISEFAERVIPVETPEREYDFVVVGGGAGGAAVASRLSEIHDWKVLLLEAGPDEPAGAQVPSFFGKFLGVRDFWDYRTTNESNACLSTGGSCSWVSGRNLGGNTAHNAMTYLRGHSEDFGNWADLGNDNWRWKDVEPFFKKGEDNGEIERVGTKHHGTGGPLSVERLPYMDPMAYSFLDASEELGWGISEDFNGDERHGFGLVQSTSRNGVRCSSAKAYLRPARNRKNLHVSLNSFVVRLIIENDRVVGVEYYKDDVLKTVHVTREVILSAGVVGSPRILLLSGIGPREHLESVGIEVVKEIPGVGENLHDHPGLALSFSLNDTDTYENNWDVATEYLASQTGPMSGIGITSVVGMIASYMESAVTPDIVIYPVGYAPNCAPGEANAIRSTGRRLGTIIPALLRPKSRGRLTLASKDPFVLPLLWANYYDVQDDLNRMVEGVKMVLKLETTEALRSYDFTLANSPVEACSDHEYLSDEYLACVIKQDNYPLYHQVGTCKMGPDSDPMAVVDTRLRVRGIKNLRAADGSIMPQVTSGNTQAPIMMIGERAAQFIKEDWDIKSSSRNGRERNVHDHTLGHGNVEATSQRRKCRV